MMGVVLRSRRGFLPQRVMRTAFHRSHLAILCVPIHKPCYSRHCTLLATGALVSELPQMTRVTKLLATTAKDSEPNLSVEHA
jgi:hypothetical protein